MRMTLREWSGSSERGGYNIGRVSKVIIHHYYLPDVKAYAPRTAEINAVRGVNSTHIKNGWGPGTGYNFNVANSGNIYDGRGWGRSGAHTEGQNSRSVGIALMIDGDKNKITPEAINAIRGLIQEGINKGFIDPNYLIRGHHDYAAKSCPGRLIYPNLEFLFGPQAVTHVESNEEEEEVAIPQWYSCAAYHNGQIIGHYVVWEDGGVGSYGGAPFFGSIPAVRPEWRRDFRGPVGIHLIDPLDCYKGYRVVDRDGDAFDFTPELWETRGRPDSVLM